MRPVTAAMSVCLLAAALALTGVVPVAASAISYRVATGRWGSVAEPASLDQVASGLDLGPARFTDYYPGPLTGAVGSYPYLAGRH